MRGRKGKTNSLPGATMILSLGVAIRKGNTVKRERVKVWRCERASTDRIQLPGSLGMGGAVPGGCQQ